MPTQGLVMGIKLLTPRCKLVIFRTAQTHFHALEEGHNYNMQYTSIIQKINRETKDSIEEVRYIYESGIPRVPLKDYKHLICFPQTMVSCNQMARAM
jgi:hypothetical protein